MDCKWHPGQDAYLACLNCGQKFCRVCISETNETYQCPDCHAAQVQRLASQMSARPAKGKPRQQKPAQVKEPRRKRERGAVPEAAPPPPAAVPPMPPQAPPAPAAPPVIEHTVPTAPAAPTVEHTVPPAPQAPPPPAEFTVPPPSSAPTEYTVPPTTAAPSPSVERVPPVPPPGVETGPPPAAQAPPRVESQPAAAPPQTPPEPRAEIPWTVAEQAPPAQLVSPPGAAPPRPAGVPVTPPAVPSPVPAVPEAPAVVEGKRRKEPRKLKKPAEKPSGRRGKRAGEAAPEPTLSTEEKDEFWGELKGPRRTAGRGARQPEPFGGAPAEPQLEAPAPVPPAAAAPGAAEAREAVVPADDSLMRDEYAPRLPTRKAKKERKKSSDRVVAMQLPDDYDGAVTGQPSYFKAVFFGLLTAVVLAAAYAGFEWWRHSGRWIFGWVIGFAVGIVVVFASGRHFSWKLGLLSTGLAWMSLCLGQFAFGMLDAKYPSVLKGISIPFPTTTLLRESALALGRAFTSLWVILFLITGLVAFLVSFRPWPVKFNLSGRPEAPRPAPPPA